MALVAKEDKSFWHRVWGHLLDLDALGLFLFASVFTISPPATELKRMLIFPPCQSWLGLRASSPHAGEQRPDCELALPSASYNRFLTSHPEQTWKSHSVIAMLVCGGVILIGFVYFEAKLAPKPLFPLRFFKSPTMLACAFIGTSIFIFFSFQGFVLIYRQL